MISRFNHRLILVFILTALLTYAFFSEKMLSNEGLGYDGLYYAKFTIHFKEWIRDHIVDKYRFQRAFIPFVIYHVFSLLHTALSVPNIILAYSIINILFIFTGVFFFFRISDFLQLSKSVEIIGFAALFFCFPILKLSLFYAVLMDVPAFVMAIILTNLYLRRKIYPFFLLILISSFIYPNSILLSVLCFFNFKKSDGTKDEKQTTSISFLDKLNPVQVLVCFALPAFLVYNYITLYWLSPSVAINRQPDTSPISWFGFLFALAYIVWLSFFSRKYFVAKAIFKSVNYSGLILSAIVYVLVQLLINSFASKAPGILTMKAYLEAITQQAVEKPLNFLAAHVFYFGLAPLLIGFFIKDIKRELVNFGFGMILFFNMALFFSIGSESRQLINYYPVFIFLLVYTLNKHWEVSIKFSVIFAVICIVLSHFWYSINKGLDEMTVYESPLEFPIQRFFMFYGPWVSDAIYKVHLAVVCFLLVLLWFLVKRTGLVKRKEEIAMTNELLA